MKKNDLIIAALAVILAFVWYFLTHRTMDGDRIDIFVNDELSASYSLSEDIDFTVDDADGNVLIRGRIRDHAADVYEASCPDRYCVRQKSIDKDGETIVCLPSRLVIVVVSDEEATLDAVAY